jgi:CRISPR-associated endoribonuclease Cas6
MRLQLTLQHPPNQVLPVNYQYLISSWIYRTLGNANAAFAQQLHEQGYDFGGKKYKLFTFSNLRPKWFDLDKRNATFTLAKSPTTLELSFHVDEAVQHFVMGLFKDQKFQLSSGRFRADFEVSGIEMLPPPTFENMMRFRAQTPICISHDIEGNNHATYLTPEDDGYVKLLLQNLLRKKNALQPVLAGEPADLLAIDFPYDFRILSQPKSKLISIKGTQVRGYLFDFELTVPEELMRIGYFGGVGEKNSSLGFGMVKTLKY